MDRKKEAKYLSDVATIEGGGAKLINSFRNPDGTYQDIDAKNLALLNINKESYEFWKETAYIPKTCLKELKDYNFLENIIKEVQLKVVGEENSIKTIFLCSCGRLVENCHLASFNLLVNSKSGSGKDFVTTATTELWSKDVCIKRTRISPTAFTYWHDANTDPNWTWDGKILVLEDISENVLNSDVFKVMQSSGSIATIVVNNKAKDIEINGKPVIIITTAKASPDIELIRRNSICQLDESPELTRKILTEQARKSMEGINDNSKHEIRKALTYLKRVKVRIPFANLFVNYFPSELVMRTAFNRFIDLIRASASLHQFQREKDEAGFVLAEEQDYNIALSVMNHLSKEGHTITLTRDQQEIINFFKEENKFYSIEEISAKIPLGDRWLRIQLDRLTEMGFLELSGFKDEKNRTIRHYKKVTNQEKIYLLQFNKLKKDLEKCSG